MKLRQILGGVALLLTCSVVNVAAVQAADPNMVCSVLNGGDDPGADDAFNSLRRKVDNFNRDYNRFCTEWIFFKNPDHPSDKLTIKLQSQLELYSEDPTCHADDAICKDGIDLLVDGTTHAPGVTIDTTGLANDECAIKVSSSGQLWRGITIYTKQTKKVGTEGAVICDSGHDNNWDGVDIKNPEGVGTCGDGAVQSSLGEECDDGANNGADKPCSTTCTKNPDADGDGIIDGNDNCPGADQPNPDQADCDGDGKGDKCDSDFDNDDVNDGIDNCPPNKDICSNPDLATRQAELQKSYNPKPAGETEQGDVDNDNHGDQCDDDMDGDGIPNGSDNCESVANPDQKDEDGDGLGAMCDPDDTPPIVDDDGDTIDDAVDNCLGLSNTDQLDTDTDGMGDACDIDKDNDGISNDAEAAICSSPIPLDPLKKDSDADGKDDGMDPCPCDPNVQCGIVTEPPVNTDADNDGVENVSDNCPSSSNASQEDGDGDGIGDACDLDNPDADTDGDGVKNGEDNCPSITNTDQTNQDSDSQGDACDPEPDQSDGEPTGGGGGCSLHASIAMSNGLWALFLGLPLAVLGSFRRRK